MELKDPNLSRALANLSMRRLADLLSVLNSLAVEEGIAVCVIIGCDTNKTLTKLRKSVLLDRKPTAWDKQFTEYD